jgi:glycine cleavage system aminomethyltransferase T
MSVNQNTSPSQPLPRQSRVVIVGGGIAGCSVAYHLAKLGWRDVLLLEQGILAGGTTWHAAGMVGRLRTSTSMARINDISAKLYASLQAETGHATAVAWNKAVPFLGRSRLLEQRKEGLRKRLASFVLHNPKPMLWGGERIFRNGDCVGLTSSGAYGHTVGGAVALGYVKHDEAITDAFLQSGDYAVEVDGEQIDAKVYLHSPYDPQSQCLLARRISPCPL